MDKDKALLQTLLIGSLLMEGENQTYSKLPDNPLGGMPTGGSTHGSEYARIISKDDWAEIAKHRNSKCECDSGKKYKHCCERKLK